MGYGSFTAGDWQKLRKSRSIDEKSTNELFTSRSADAKYDPKFIGKREARDSEEHPNSTPIIIGVDVTGSMGYLSTNIIQKSLRDLMEMLYSTDKITDPQLMFAAIGDASVDTAPLQVTQFESDIRIAEQLLDLWLENKGGDFPEDYELLWYFADKHTDIDSFTKYGRKGFCFTIGDAPFHDTLKKRDIKKIFDDDVMFNISSKELAKRASKKYELFHIAIGDKPCNASNIIPGRVIHIEKSQIDYLPEILVSVMQKVMGVPLETVLEQWGELSREVVKQSVSSLRIANNNNQIVL